jgi:ubiquinone/menaquinone biosynthesis C-methylase UbiE
MAPDVVERQEREQAYHRDYAATQAHQLVQPPLLDVLARTGRKWWNSHWRIYDILLDADLKGKRVLIAGCGLGDDACRLASLGAEVHAFDISPELVALARERAVRFGFPPIHFDTMPAESTTYPDAFFDVALFHGVFHHISIDPALTELDRIMKPGGLLVAHEQYTHSSLGRLRNSRFIRQVVYPRLSRLIYGTDKPYITEDEEKLDERQVGSILGRLTDIRAYYFCILEGRLFSTHIPWAARWDQWAMHLLGPLGSYIAGQIVFAGTWRGQSAR